MTDVVLYKCPFCFGDGRIPIWITDHSPYCDGYNCSDECPIELPDEEECYDCWGTGEITYEILAQRLARHYNTLDAIEKLHEITGGL